MDSDQQADGRYEHGAGTAERAPRRDQRPDDKKKGGGYGKFFLIALVLVVVLAVLAALAIRNLVHSRHERDETSRVVQAGAVTVQVTKPALSPPVFDFNLPGSSEPITTATLYARINGYLKTRLVDIGDRVEKGQLLAEIDAPELDAQLLQAKSQLLQLRAAADIAKVTYQREKQLLDQKVVSKQEHDQAEANFNQAIANVKAGEANVQNLTVQQGFEKITAPFNGVVTTRFLDDGALINGGSGTASASIYTVSAVDVLRVFIYVPQAYAPNILPGQEVEITASEYPQKVFHGKVTRTADSLDPVARTERVEVQLPSEDGKLLPGMYLTIRFKVQQNEPALIVPANAVDLLRPEGPRVAVVGPDDKVNYRGVKVGRDFGKTLEVVSGLKGDERLVVNPTTDLVEGEKVDVAKPPPPSPSPGAKK